METSTQTLTELITLFAPRAAGGMAVFIGFWVGGNIVQRIINRIASKNEPGRKDIMRLMAQIAKVTLLLVGLVSALGTLGINVSAMVAGLGLTGFALSFALKDVLSNAVAGILILFYCPFKRGDNIAAAGFEGQVTSIDLRYTTLASKDGKVLIPNSTLFTKNVTVLPPDNS